MLFCFVALHDVPLGSHARTSNTREPATGLSHSRGHQAHQPCAVSEENWRTPFWVDLCQEAGMVLRKLRRDQVTCRPLPVPVPLAGMLGVRCDSCLCCYQ